MSKKESSKKHKHEAKDNIALITVDQRSRADRKAEGKAMRLAVPLASHATWQAPEHRRDPVEVLIESGKNRIAELLPIRYGRMLQSSFAFYRGAASIMAADLASLPKTGIHVQVCGDCHLLNFGTFATPERRLIFAINDFDETLPAPWEWDVKRLATSFAIASQTNGFTDEEIDDAVKNCVRSYREQMREFAKMRTLDVWYFSIDAEELVENISDETVKQRTKKRIEKAKNRDVLDEDFPKLATFENGDYCIRDNPPLIYHHQDIAKESTLHDAFKRYRATLSADKQTLFDRYEFKDLAAKVVGVGSVGTRCAIALFMDGAEDPLFLQVKEASASVLEPYVGQSAYDNHGQRVVMGQRLMLSATDIFLGWVENNDGKQFYIRQLRDMKIKPLVELFSPDTMNQYAEICGLALAHAHARSGDAAKIAGYLGKKSEFDEAIAKFALAYAEQNEQDYQALKQAVQQGRLEAYIQN